MMDFLREGTTRWVYVHPPRLDKEAVKTYSDSLKGIILEKTDELLELKEKGEEEKKAFQKEMKSRSKQATHFDSYFSSIQLECEYQFLDYVEEWLRYWKRIWQILVPPPPLRIKKGYSYDEIETARSRPIEDYYEGELRHKGSSFMGICPFHEEKTPSFFIETSDNHFHCYGCQAHGDVITFVMRHFKLNFKETIAKLL